MIFNAKFLIFFDHAILGKANMSCFQVFFVSKDFVYQKALIRTFHTSFLDTQ